MRTLWLAMLALALAGCSRGPRVQFAWDKSRPDGGVAEYKLVYGQLTRGTNRWEVHCSRSVTAAWTHRLPDGAYFAYVVAVSPAGDESDTASLMFFMVTNRHYGGSIRLDDPAYAEPKSRLKLEKPKFIRI